MRKKLAEFLSRNTALRVIAIVLAIGLWLFVNTGQHESQISMEVPISYRGLPRGLMIVNQRPDFVDLQVSGPRTLLSLLDPGRLELRLDLTGVAPGQASFRIGPEMFNVPRQTMVTRVSPSQIVLDIDRLMAREVPVHLNITGPIANGYKVAEVDVKPAFVAISGPSRDVLHLDRIETDPVDVRDVTDQAVREVGLLIPPGPIRVSTDQVEARVKFDEVMGDREFRTIEVEVRDSGSNYRLYTRKVNVTVRGPVLKLASLNLDGMVYVDARGVQPGFHELPVQADLPDGMQVVRYSPEKVKLRILVSKEATGS